MATRTDLGKWMITNGGEYDERTEYEALTMVMYNNSTFITLKTVTGVEPTDDRKNYILMAKGFDPTALASVRAKDTHGVLSLGTPTQPPAEVSAQELIDGLAAPAFDDAGTATGITGFQNFIDSVKSGMKILDFFKNLKTGLKFVLHTGQLVNNGLCNDPGKYPLDAAYGKTLLDMITKCQTDITSLNSEKLKIKDTLLQNIVVNHQTAGGSYNTDTPFATLESLGISGATVISYGVSSYGNTPASYTLTYSNGNFHIISTVIQTIGQLGLRVTYY